MKHFIFITFILITSIYSVFAETTIDFSSDKRIYDIEDTINLNIRLQTGNLGETALNIEGIDNFQIVGKRQSQSRTNINGEQSSNFTLNLALLAEKAGNYTLGPITTGSGTGTISSETIDIEVTGERIMINSQLNNSQNIPQDNEQEEEEQAIDDIVLNQGPQSGSISEEELQQKIILGVDGEEMTDIYKQEGFMYSYALLKK